MALPPHFIDLVKDSLLKSFWRKAALRTFLTRHKVKESFLSTWAADESKRDFLERLFPRLEANDAGEQVVKQMAVSLADQIAFPDLKGWEDEGLKIKSAADAVAALKTYVTRAKDEERGQKEKDAIRKAAILEKEENRRHTQTLDTLQGRLRELVPSQGTQDGGYRFQDWFYDLVEFFEMPCRRPYVASGRQIDGTITVEGT